jgi:hypothetical protein
MNATTDQPCYISLNRLARLCGRSRVTLLLRLKDGMLPPDAVLDPGNGKLLPLFLAQRALQLQRAPEPLIEENTPKPPAAPSASAPHPLL